MIPIAPGVRLGRYQIRSKLGAGGMGEVYLADDLELGRPVAIKVLPSEDKADPTARKRLVREARAAAGLDHPHICAVKPAKPTVMSSSPCNTSRARRSTHACGRGRSSSPTRSRSPCRSSTRSARRTSTASCIAISNRRT